MQARQARHLRPALNLEHANRIRLLQGGINHGIIRRQHGQIHIFFIVIANQCERIFERCHHAEAQQIDLDDAHVGAIFLVPLHHHATGHGGRLERYDGIQLPLADDHASGVLSQMTRQILYRDAKLEELANARMLQIEPRIAKLPFQRVVGVLVFPRTHQADSLSSVSSSKPSTLPTSRAADRPR